MRASKRVWQLVLGTLLVGACVAPSPGDGATHRWWAGLGPVLPHDTFPADCKLCHVGEKWNELTATFQFDHEKRTGVPLHGAHGRAMCLRCHNDRGPVKTFQAKGCVGCHEDRHNGKLGTRCTKCHQERTWQPVGQIELHNKTRFPLTGAHAATSCYRCHPGGLVGNFQPTDTRCVTCHQDDLAATKNPPHVGLGWTANCNRCHLPTRWRQAVIR
ncbi:MAG: hypothetical protein KDC87_10650 [Planctomycetes bacterium]|nr:hypothetical protein [Planctomycetota bacterium]MCB9868800.1 hypothetical protein [Planctomycetota bacterium]